MNEAGFQARAEHLLERGVDVTRAGDGAAAARLLLLIALRRMGDAVPGGSAAWDHLADHGDGGVASRLADLAHRLEQERPVLRGIFTGALDREHGESNELLPAWVRELRGMGPVEERDAPSTFPTWFDRAVDAVAARTAGRGQPSTTPRALADLMVRLAPPERGWSAYDPCCGHGGTLAAVARTMPYSSKLAGQDIDGDAVRLARLRLLLLTDLPAAIEAGDTLRRPMNLTGGVVERFDAVFCHPPLGQRLSDVAFAEHDAHGRFRLGRPGRTGSEFAFVQHGLASLRSRGRGAFLLPPGPLFRGGADAAIRAGLVEEGLVASVVGLPVGLLPGVSIEAHILVVDLARARNGDVTFVDASEHRDAARDARAWSKLADEVVLACSARRAAIPGFSDSVAVRDIVAGGSSLHPRAHVPRRPSTRDEHGDPASLLRVAAEAEAEAMDAAGAMDALAASLLDGSHD